MIAQIRQLTGASIRCTELDVENRLVLIMGGLVQVLNAFDVILQVRTPPPASAAGSNVGQRPLSISTASSINQSDNLTVCLMMEHAKAGRVVGSRGSTLLSLKNRSNATVRVEKDPTVSFVWACLLYLHPMILNLTIRIVYRSSTELCCGRFPSKEAASRSECTQHSSIAMHCINQY